MTRTSADPGRTAQANAAIAGVTVVSARGVTLITGDSVRLVRTADGKTVVQKLPAFRSGPGAALQTIRTPKDTYVIPLMARPYLNRFLDPALFDVTKLAAAGAHGKIPIRIAFGGGQVPRCPA